MTDKERRCVTFDEVALLYDQVRPGYPEALFDDVIRLSHIPPGGHILEIGCGTGQATIPFVRRGFSMHCIELGANLAAVAQRKLAPYPNVEVSIGAFETWPIQDDYYDLVISATAFHWIDPAVGYQKTAQALKPNGAIALFWNNHVQTEVSAGFFDAVQTVYERLAPTMAKRFPTLPHPENIPTPVKDDLQQTGLFGQVSVYKYPWHIEYDAATYINLLNTYSDHRSLDDTTRKRLFKEIASFIGAQFGGQITKEYLTILYVAHRR